MTSLLLLLEYLQTQRLQEEQQSSSTEKGKGGIDERRYRSDQVRHRVKKRSLGEGGF